MVLLCGWNEIYISAKIQKFQKLPKRFSNISLLKRQNIFMCDEHVFAICKFESVAHFQSLATFPGTSLPCNLDISWYCKISSNLIRCITSIYNGARDLCHDHDWVFNVEYLEGRHSLKNGLCNGVDHEFRITSP